MLGSLGTLIYRVRHGCLTQTVLANYAGHNGEDIPPPAALVRQEVRDEAGRRHRGRWQVIDEVKRIRCLQEPFEAQLHILKGVFFSADR